MWYICVSKGVVSAGSMCDPYNVRILGVVFTGNGVLRRILGVHFRGRWVDFDTLGRVVFECFGVGVDF